MKIFLVLTILLLITSSIYAADWDLDKGSKEVGGYFSFRYFSGDLYEDGGEGISSFTLSPNFQIFIQPRLSIGGFVYISNTKQGDETWNSLGIGPGLTYYFGNSESKYWPFIGTNFLITSETWKDNGNGGFYDNDDETSGSSFQFAGGMMYKLVDHLHIKGLLYYNFNSSDVDWDHAKQSGNVIGLQFGFSGFIY